MTNKPTEPMSLEGKCVVPKDDLTAYMVHRSPYCQPIENDDIDKSYGILRDAIQQDNSGLVAAHKDHVMTFAEADFIKYTFTQLVSGGSITNIEVRDVIDLLNRVANYPKKGKGSYLLAPMLNSKSSLEEQDDA